MARRERCVALARIAEQAERYGDMTEYMAEVVSHFPLQELSVEERNLFSVAFKNCAGSCRAALRISLAIEEKQKALGNDTQAEFAGTFRANVEGELDDICVRAIQLLEDHLIENASSGESKVFYHKMIADYYRYLAECRTGDAKKEAIDTAKAAMEESHRILSTELPTTHPIRLGLALSYAVFNYEVVGDADTAVSIARTAFEDAIMRLEDLDEESYKDSTLIMSLLRDNLTLWTTQDENTTQP